MAFKVNASWYVIYVTSGSWDGGLCVGMFWQLHDRCMVSETGKKRNKDTSNERDLET